MVERSETDVERAALARAVTMFQELAHKVRIAAISQNPTPSSKSMTSRSKALAYGGAQVVLVFALNSAEQTAPRAAFLVYHPERRTLIPRGFQLNWKRLEDITRYGVVRFKEDLYFLGGYDERRKKWKRQCLRYDLKRGRMYVCEKMVTPRVDFTPFVFEGRIYCCGGRSRDDQLTRASEYFEPMLGRWYRDTSLPVACAQYGVTVADKVVILIGGIVPGDQATQHASSHFWRMTKEFQTNQDQLDELVSVWTELPAAAFPSSHGVHRHRCVFSPKDRRIYVIGGVRGGYGAEVEFRSSGDAGLYYLNMDELPSPKSMTSPILWKRRHISGCQRAGPGVCTIEHKIFVIGGETGKNSKLGVLREEEGEEEEEEEEKENVQDSAMEKEAEKEESKITEEEENETVVGCYDWKTKEWTSLFSFENMIDCREVCCVHLEPNMPMKEFDFDRMDWLLQWALW